MNNQPARPQPLTAEELAENTIRRYKNMDPGHESPMTMLWADTAFQLACAVKCPVDAAKPPAVQVDRPAIVKVLTQVYAREYWTVFDMADALIASGHVSTPPAAQVDCNHLHCPKYWTASQLAAADAEAAQIYAAIHPKAAAQAPEAPAAAGTVPGTRVVCIECHLPDELPESPDCWAKCTVPECPIKAATDPDKGRGE